MMTSDHIHQSNLIEEIDSAAEDIQSMEAWSYISRKEHLTYENVMELHRLITLNQLPKSESGCTRKVNVWIGGKMAPNPVVADSLLRNFILDIEHYWHRIDPIEAHVRFEHIHPFVDGNGRTGRMLLWWHEHKREMEPTLFLAAEKFEKYYPLFEEKKRES